ncbi:uncharacterized protein LOC34617535 [Cyclospora cayetanensis]|uniref:Uncharacterized protein LOC34617535 n=1 Tax=Cyclospora cayetanensis TaxID=88456 RepID=A0A6P6RVD3_9EIME|nr:uncharacterized protein LOC34617535 [Cyclospora cayetanensis]
MATSLLFQELQQSGSLALHHLHAVLTPRDDDTRRKESCIIGSPRYGEIPCYTASCTSKNISCMEISDGTNTSCKYHNNIQDVSSRIISLSHRLVPPEAPFFKNLADTGPASACRSGCKSLTSTSSSFSVTTDSAVKPVGSLAACAIDSASLSSAVFIPTVQPLLRALWEECSSRAWLSRRINTNLAPTKTPDGALTVDAWQLQPDKQRSDSLKLWGNSALSRGRTAAAESLYTAAITLIPDSSVDDSRNSRSGGDGSSSNNNPLAVLQANRSLALLRLGRNPEALRAATEAAAVDPLYCKAWYRRAVALERLREAVEQRIRSPCRVRQCSGTSCCNATRMCLQRIDSELSMAQRMSRGNVSFSEAKGAADCMTVGTCGCEFGREDWSGCINTGELGTEATLPRLWLREDVSVQLNGKGRGLMTGELQEENREEDEDLVLEEDAFAVYVHPKHCAKIPRIPIASLSYSARSVDNCGPNAVQTHSGTAVHSTWEDRLESCRGAPHVSGSPSEGPFTAVQGEDGSGGMLEAFCEAESVCAGCATVPARGEAGGVSCSGVDSERSALHRLLRPVFPVVPCGSCAGAFFCCNRCRAASAHKRVCCMQQPQGQSTKQASKVEAESAKRLPEGVLVQPLALALPDPHRHIARQLLSCLLTQRAVPEGPAQRGVQATTTEAPVGTGSVGAASGQSSLQEQAPPWYQLLRSNACVLLEVPRLADWLLNAAWLAGDAAAAGKGMQCGGRCLLCNPPDGRNLCLPLRQWAETAPTMVTQETAEAEALADSPSKPAGDRLCTRCCMCCKAWCCTCSPRSSVFEGTRNSEDRLAALPRCLYTAALHAYGVACCNSFTMRVACDPEEEAVAAGTALFLTASLLNHSCSPNAVAVFGEPRSWKRHQRREQQADTCCLEINRNDWLLAGACSGLGRGTLLQVRLCLPEAFTAKKFNGEISISYGPLVGLESGAWGFRQEWLLRHAGFYCRCEVRLHSSACAPPRGHTSADHSGVIHFEKGLLCGTPCPVCTTAPLVQKLLKEAPEATSAYTPDNDPLYGMVAAFKRYVGPQIGELRALKGRRRQQQQQQHLEEPSVYSELSTATLGFVTEAFSNMLFEELVIGEARHQWTHTRSLALLGHSCVQLWSAISSEDRRSAVQSAALPSFLNCHRPLYACSELQCLNCKTVFSASAMAEEREAAHLRLNDLRTTLACLVRPAERGREMERHALLGNVSTELVQAIPHVVAASGCLSTDTWLALQAVARAAHAQADAARQLQMRAWELGVIGAVGLAATCLSAGVHVLVQRLPLGFAQPEVAAHMYKAALLYARSGNHEQAKQLVKRALKGTRNSCGPHSVIRSHLEEYLQWMEQE